MMEARMEIKDIEKLANLARIRITDEEKATFLTEIDAILKYVGEIQKATVGTSHTEVGAVYNVLREDGPANIPGQYTEAILTEAPEVAENCIKVKKIL